MFCALLYACNCRLFEIKLFKMSMESPKWKNGAFTKALVEGLAGKADYSKSKGIVTVNMLDLFISERVKELTSGQQTPTTAKPSTVPDFPIAMK